MANPSGYTPSYSFGNYQSNTPNKPLPGVRVDIELYNISQAIGGLVLAVEDVRRSDGAIQNGAVTWDSLSSTLQGIIRGSIGIPPVAGTISVFSAQLKRALVQSGALNPQIVANAVPPDPADPANIEWTGGGLVVYPGTVSPNSLATVIQTALGYSTVQMQALFALAALQRL